MERIPLMKTPICSICLESDLLCPGCNERLESNEITPVALDVIRFLHSLSQDLPLLEDVELKNVLTTSNAVIILTGKGDAAKVVGKKGSIVKQIAAKTEKSVRVLEESNSVEEVVRNLLAPVQIQSINTIYKPEGTEKRIVVSKDQRKRIPLTRNGFSTIVKILTGESVNLTFS